MKTGLLVSAFSTLALVAQAGPTRECNAEPRISSVILFSPSSLLPDRIDRALGLPGSDPALMQVLGDVQSKSRYSTPSGVFSLGYKVVDDPVEISARINASPEIRSQLSAPASPDGWACFSAGLFPAKKVVVTEYRNVLLDHYFLSSSDAENQMIDSGAAGPGWSRTGESFTTYMPEACVAPQVQYMVWRFYGTPGVGSNSHFFTAGTVECGNLRNGIGWSYEGPAFGADLPTAGACPARSPVPVYRAYNMRSQQNDSNHRHTTSLATYQQMQSRGWFGEGVAFCVPNPS